jgi:hypothetical protein
VGYAQGCATGNFIVTAAQTGTKYGNANGYLACRLADYDETNGSTYSATPWAYQDAASTPGTMAETGRVYLSNSGSVVIEECVTNTTYASIATTDLTGIQVNSVAITGGSRQSGPRARKPVQHTFTPSASQRARAATQYLRAGNDQKGDGTHK